MGICVLMLVAKKSTYPDVPKSDRLSSILEIYGVYTDARAGAARIAVAGETTKAVAGASMSERAASIGDCEDFF